MDIFGVISLLGGLALFLYGMSVLGSGLERTSGGRLEKTLEKLTNSVLKSVLFGAVVTAAVQSSSATTVIVVGLVNSRILGLRQAIGVIMGANIGTTITAHILRLADLSGGGFLLQMLKPTTLAPLVAVIGIILYMTARKSSHKEIGQVMLGFSILFTGLFAMEAAVAPLKDVPEFTALFAKFQNPILGVLVGAVVTGIIQSSSASVGILQALSSTGMITYASAFPIIMGQNIGTCVTPLIASIGASKNAKRTAVVHLSFNVIGTIVFLIGTYTIQALIGFPFWLDPIDKGGIANFHTLFNVVVTLLFLPFTKQLEKLACAIVKDSPEDMDSDDVALELDERFMRSPGLAIQQGRKIIVKMGFLAKENFVSAMGLMRHYDSKKVERINEVEDMLDRMEDRLSAYLLMVSAQELSEKDSRAVSELLHVVSEYERVGDYSVNVMEAAETMYQRGSKFSKAAQAEMDTIGQAVYEILDISVSAFESEDVQVATNIEPLEEVIDLMEETLKDRHIERLRQGKCTPDAAFPFVEALSCLERIADHCANVGTYIISHEGEKDGDFDRHEYLRMIHKGETEHYAEHFSAYEKKYYDRIALAED